jgi:S-adenosylmethionine:diacylglycerol 3-amino-3-carboxypropyl transferase
MNMLTTVKTLADVRQVLRGYAAAHPPEAEDYYDRRLAERAAAKAKEEKERISRTGRLSVSAFMQDQCYVGFDIDRATAEGS